VRALAGLAALAVSLGGCGGGDENGPANSAGQAGTTPTAGQTTPENVPTAPGGPSTSTSTTTPANPPGAASTVPGGSEPARTEVTFTATSAGVKPLRAGVAPYIAVKVTLESKDGSSHTLTIAGKTLKVGGTRKSEFVTLPGLRPGAGYKGRVDGQKAVRILGTAEPGP
jgi:hypothetical protein